MNKSILVISNTYFQLIVAIQLKETCWFNDKVDIVITDQSNNSEKVAKNLSKLQIFNKVIWRKTKNLCQNTSNIYLNIKKYKYICFGITDIKIIQNFYDELVYYNPDIYTYGIFSKLKKNNSNLHVCRFEEGILSYTDSVYLENSKLKYSNIIRKLFKKTLLDEETNNFYCFYPEMYFGNMNPIEIHKIKDYKIMGDNLKKIFNLNDDMLHIKEKYIFFTGVFDFEGGGPIGEFELVLKVAGLVGKENLIVKTHPRDNRTVYAENGLKVYKHSYIPWEAIQFNNDFSEKILLTVNSGSILGANLILENKAQSYFLFNCCNIENNYEASRYMKTVRQLLSAAAPVLDKINIVENIDSLAQIGN